MGNPVGYQVLDGDDFQTETLCYLLQLRHTGHGAVVVDNLNQCTCGLQSCQTGQIDSCLGMSGSYQYATVTGA